ncbi:hypothetical protein HYX08_01980 [Candidatus Woesearchaeota archaeon]|nr:hypothetical protein [Candidatus Woesearchaeota archaeon]
MIAMPFLAITAGSSIVNVLKNLRGKWKFIASAALLAVFAWNLSSDVMFLEKIGFTRFERGPDLREFILANSDSGTLLFGDNSAVPLLALMTDRKIAFDYADTNEQVFLSGLADLDNVLDSLKGNDILFIARSTQGISSFRETRDFLNTNCGLLGSFHDKTEGDYLFYKCR